MANIKHNIALNFDVIARGMANLTLLNQKMKEHMRVIRDTNNVSKTRVATMASTLRQINAQNNLIDFAKKQGFAYNDITAAVNAELAKQRAGVHQTADALISQTTGMDKLNSKSSVVRANFTWLNSVTTGFLGTLLMTNTAFKSAINNNANFASAGSKTAAALRMLTAGTKGFKMELLGLMFFGMFVGGMITRLFAPSLRLAGVFELISMILGLFFLPAAMLLLPYLLGLLDWVNNQNDDFKILIGVILGFIAVLLLVIGFLSQLGLGFGAIIGMLQAVVIAWELLTMAFSSVATFIGGILTGTFLTILAIVLLVIAGILYNWNNVMSSLGFIFEGLVQIVGGGVQLLIGAFTMLFGLIIGDAEMAKQGASDVLNGLLTIVEGIYNLVIRGLFSLVLEVVRGILGFVLSIPKFLDDVVESILKFLIDLKIPFISEFAEMALGAYEAIKGMVYNIKDVLMEVPIVGDLIKFIFGTIDVLTLQSHADTLISYLERGFSKMLSGFGIPGFAAGGIVTSPTLAMVGERGPEAIVPLNNAGGTFAPSITINVTGSGIDARDIANEVDKVLSDRYRRFK